MTEETSRQLPLHQRVNCVNDILEAIPLTTPVRRAALLAVAGVIYRTDIPVTDYAGALMGLSDADLEELSGVAQGAAMIHPMPIPENPIPEDERTRYLATVREVAESVDADEELTADDRRHFKALVQQLADALDAAPETGARPVETAAKAVIGDSQINSERWQRIARKKWAQKLAAAVTAVLMLVGSYSSAKELAQDISAWFHQAPAITAQQSPPQSEGTDEIHDAEIVPEGESEQPG